MPFIVWKLGCEKMLAVTADVQMHIQLEQLSIANAACVGCPSCYYELTVGGRDEKPREPENGTTGQYSRALSAWTHPRASFLRGLSSFCSTQTLSLPSKHSCVDEIEAIY